MAADSVTPMVLSTFEQHIVSQFSGAFATVSTYAVALFYIVAVIELTLFGLMWALRQEAAWGSFLFKIICYSQELILLTRFQLLHEYQLKRTWVFCSFGVYHDNYLPKALHMKLFDLLQ